MKFKYLFLSLGLLFSFLGMEAQDKKPDFDKMRETRTMLSKAFEKEVFPSLKGEHEVLMASLSEEDKRKLASLRVEFKNLKEAQKEATKKIKNQLSDDVDPIDRKEKIYEAKAPFVAKMKELKENELKPLIERNKEALSKSQESLKPVLEKWKQIKLDIMREAREGKEEPKAEERQNNEADKKNKMMRAAHFLLWDGTLESAQKMMLKKGGKKKGKGKKGASKRG